MLLGENTATEVKALYQSCSKHPHMMMVALVKFLHVGRFLLAEHSGPVNGAAHCGCSLWWWVLAIFLSA